ncbi:MAG: TonB-dependent receptor [Undibacterium sp.]|nr:TonB-dependent receptor [Undibacterium sp.]
MIYKHSVLSLAIFSAFTPLCFSAHAQDTRVVVSANPLGKEESMQILSPAKVLSGSELRSKVGSSLGETLGSELGVSASGFGAGASRPIIRGLEGARVKILQNGMNVADVSSLSNDHAVASDSASAQQIEILRGPAALLYGSGAIGGLVNVVDGRIPSVLSKQVNGETEVKYGSVNAEKSSSFFLDGSSSDIAWHLDGNTRKTDDYKIPGYAAAGSKLGMMGQLASSFTREDSLGVGSSLIQSWGHVGVSVQHMRDRYGIPTEEKSFIDMQQTRYDLDGAIYQSLLMFDAIKFKLGSTQYRHTEKQQDGTPSTIFNNRAFETRLTFSHGNFYGWEGSMGVQTETSQFSALAASTGRADTVPTTSSVSNAIFALEQKTFGSVIASTGARFETVSREPQAQFALPRRQFDLFSASLGGMWQLGEGYALLSSFSLAKRAPATEELYANGPHESSATFDVGSRNLKTENSKNWEFSAQKTSGKLQWKLNVFLNQVDNYVYGELDGHKVNAEGENEVDGEFAKRLWKQAAATIHGGEAELSYNQHAEGFSARAFADVSHAKLNQQGNLPLQPASRVGVELGYRQAGWRNTISVIHALRQDRLAASETFVTPAFTKVDLNVSYTYPYLNTQVTWFAQIKNLLNQDIRLATSLLKETVPQAKRGLVAGLRLSF